jgi:hypothetical protein
LRFYIHVHAISFGWWRVVAIQAKYERGLTMANGKPKPKVRKCNICNNRPVYQGGYCHDCLNSMAAEKRRKRKVPYRYISHKGVTVALYRGKGENLKVELTNRDPMKLPQYKLINLDLYCPNYSREQVKKMKKLCLAMSRVK